MATVRTSIIGVLVTRIPRTEEAADALGIAAASSAWTVAATDASATGIVAVTPTDCEANVSLTSDGEMGASTELAVLASAACRRLRSELPSS